MGVHVMIRTKYKCDGFTLVDYSSSYADGWGEVEAPTRDGLEKGIEDYYNRYPFGGYQTRIRKEPFKGSDGMWRAELGRWKSCD